MEETLRKKIFVSEDDEFYAKILATKLEIDGFDVKIFENGKQLIDAVNKITPELIVIDLMTPVVDGFETLRILGENQTLNDVPKIVITNLSQEEDIKRTRVLGASAHLIKSEQSIHELVNVVKSYIKNDLKPKTDNSITSENETHINPEAEDNQIIKGF